eukprot:TRINITY_DN304_c2_g1_i1.p1 TRINITY_DN304_c2_g1~~TRINITY_DN304_c2_g1_i1.p1  ORF type:complete len:398 (+),score=37.24 TRINITY_DN304_c2_g1_i1:79-1194(+)
MSAFQKPATFSKLGDKTFGPKGHIYTEVCVILFLIGAQVSYMIIIGELFTPLVHEYLSITPTEHDKTIVTGIIAAVIILPLSTLRHMDSLQYTSFIALFFIGSLLIAVLVKGVRALITYGIDFDILWFGDFEGFFAALPIVNFAFTFHPSIPHVWDELHDSSPKNINFISFFSVLFCSVFYLTLGIFGYLYNGLQTPGNILMAYNNDKLFDALKFGYSLVIIFSYPVLNYATRNGIDNIIFRKQPAPLIRYFLESLIIVGITFTIAILLPDLEFVFGFMGATFGQLVIFINPALFYLRLYQNEDVSIKAERGGYEVYSREDTITKISWKNTCTPRKFPAVLLIIFGLVCGTVSVIVSINKLINSPPLPIGN